MNDKTWRARRAREFLCVPHLVMGTYAATAFRRATRDLALAHSAEGIAPGVVLGYDLAIERLVEVAVAYAARCLDFAWDDGEQRIVVTRREEKDEEGRMRGGSSIPQRRHPPQSIGPGRPPSIVEPLQTTQQQVRGDVQQQQQQQQGRGNVQQQVRDNVQQQQQQQQHKE